MADRYTGAWRNRLGTQTDEHKGLGQADPARHMNDYSAGLHMVDDTAATRRQVQTPYALDPPPQELIDATDSSALMATSTSGVPMNLESSDDHGIGDSGWSENNTTRDVVMPTRVHQRDQGSMWARRIRQPRLPQWDEKFTTPRLAANDNVSNSDRQRIIGSQFAGANPTNNPAETVQRTRGDEKAMQSPPVGWAGAPRRGFRVFRFDERKIPMHRVRHDSRWLPLHLARTAQDSPEPLSGNQYVSPYATLANTRIGNVLAPMLRRQPNDWDQEVVTDGSTQIPETFSVWGL